ncbi:MAG: hypothetical protein KAX05_07075 [Bacteroidales bacterium]|nr:hypothetical protein [Bacteroidales bacterium]
MKKILITGFLTISVILLFAKLPAQQLIYHDIEVDKDGHIIPWYSEDPGRSYDHIINLVWDFWDTMRIDMNGVPYHMNHQVWKEKVNDHRGIGGDQIQMALSSWALLYAYTGNQRILENMKFMADYYLTHSLSPPDYKWPDIPYPYNTYIYSGIYDGDMILGQGYTQPDKAGSFGIELITLYKITGRENYLDAAIRIANTLAINVKKGDNDNSPLPFKVHARTGEIGKLYDWRAKKVEGYSSYTTNWTGTMRLFTELIKMKKGNEADYQSAFDVFVDWMKNYPLKTNKWGPFFEDIHGWSDTQINAVTFAQYIMENRELFPDWQSQARGILDWVYQRLGNREWEQYGVIVVNEQTAYEVPGNSHSSRQASMELLYAKLTGDNTWKDNAIRQLNWATYMVDVDGKNRYPRNQIWMTDGYGDYIRHYLRAMAYEPELSPDNAIHILSTTSVIKNIEYAMQPVNSDENSENILIFYQTYDISSEESIRLMAKPGKVLADKKTLNEVNSLDGEGWIWKPLKKGGVLTIRHKDGSKITVLR